MILPDIINYLLALRYPGSVNERQSWVCYQGYIQYRVPVIRSGQTISYTVRPPQGIHAQLGYDIRFGSDMMPYVFTITVSQFGSMPFGGLVTQLVKEDNIAGFVLATEQEPMYMSITNISPLSQRGEMAGTALMISTPHDMEVIIDALRRLHTSTKSEELLQQAVNLLGLLTRQPEEPRPLIGGS